MSDIYKIWSVTLYEVKSLIRSKIFILYYLMIFLFFFISTMQLHDQWNAHCISSFIPYNFIKNFNLIQAFICVLLVSDFFSNEISQNTIDSIRIRSYTNAEYIIGKSLGIFAVLFIINIFYSLGAILVNILIFSDVSVKFICYLYYPLLLTAPTLIFLIGITSVVSVLFVYRAVTIILMFGYITITIIIGGCYYNIFDVLCWRIPFVYSDFTGFGNLPLLICQRLIYTLTGLSGIFITAFFLKRLPQSKTAYRLSVIIPVLFLTGVTFLSIRLHDTLLSGKVLRHDINELNKTMVEQPQVSVTGYDLDLIHNGDEIEVEANIIIKNFNNFPVNRLIFSLNPGLEVINIGSGGKRLNYERNLHILSVEPPGKTLQSNQTDSLSIHYKGRINEEACYPIIDENERKERNLIYSFNIEKRYAFITSNYVLLTHENLWYPVAGVIGGHVNTQGFNKNFANFKLAVTTKRSLTVISQGHSEKTGEGKYLFVPEEPLPQLSLVIGNYEKKSTTVDNIEYSIYVKEGHDYFSRHFKNIGDLLPATIKKIKQDFELRTDIAYQFPRFSLVEVPVQFIAYQSEWGINSATVQPEQVFLGEKGVYFRHYGDFKYIHRVIVGTPGYRFESPGEIEDAMLRYFAKFNFTDITTQHQLVWFRKEKMSEPGLSLDELGLGSSYPLYEYNYNLYPLYYCHTNHIASNRIPFSDSVISYYLRSKLIHHYTSGFAVNESIPIKTKVVRTLSQKSLKEIISDTEFKLIPGVALKLKAEYLFMYMFSKSGIGKENFDSVLHSFLSKNRFKTVDLNDFSEAIAKEFDIDFESILMDWYHQKKLPGYKVYDLKYAGLYDNNRLKYQVYLTIQNISDVDGVVYAMMDNGGIIGERYTFLKGHQTKQIGMILDKEPVYGIRIDPFISRHYFYIDNYLDKYEADKNEVLFEGERVIDSPAKPDFIQIIVDNLDPGFQILSQPGKSFVMKYLFKNTNDDSNEFKAFNIRKPPGKWRYGFWEHFYGDPETSAYYIRSGQGNSSVSWKAEIPENGNYDIYYYTPHHNNFRFPLIKYACTDLNFLVYHDEGVDDVTLDITNTQKVWNNINNYTLKGWTYIGTYRLSKGTATVELTDKSTGPFVYADAVKWVKK
ncbi:MAG: hypothetical protein JXB48_20010 [Candidatus Latescibacteria bacterium]|nr:hypothetical protein [Candidatus Latescibacterota bacterium]